MVNLCMAQRLITNTDDDGRDFLTDMNDSYDLWKDQRSESKADKQA